MPYGDNINPPYAMGMRYGLDLKLKEINEISKEIPLLIAPNMSMGIALFKKILDYSKEVLNVASSIEFYEQHHKEKKDSPSGTAINLKDQVAIPESK